MTTMINKEKAYDKIIYLFRMETSNKLGCEGKATFFHKEYLPKTRQTTLWQILQLWQIFKTSVLPLGRRQGCLL